MYKKIVFLVVLSLVTVLSGCANTGRGPNEQSGMIIGGILGGVLGSNVGDGDGRTVAIVIGSIAGAAIGGNVGRSMDETDRMKTGQTLETVRTGVPSSWKNPDTGNEYTVVPTKTYETRSGPCREYTVNANIGGQPEQIYGTACRQNDGSWVVQN